MFIKTVIWVEKAKRKVKSKGGECATKTKMSYWVYLNEGLY